MTGVIFRLGSTVLEQLARFGEMMLLLWDVLKTTLTRRPRWRVTFEQAYQIGWQSQVVVIITGAFTGMVFAVRTGMQFHKVKMDSMVGAVVSLAMLRELAPVLTGLMVAGRVGASIAAELGTMKVTEQRDALRSMGTSPVDYLAVPRFVALLGSLPLLTAEAMAFGIYAGYLVSVRLLGIDSVYFFSNMYKYTKANDVFQGLFKSVFFALFIALIACHKGFTAGEGAEGVGHATTRTVVAASLTILIANFFIALTYNAVFPP